MEQAKSLRPTTLAPLTVALPEKGHVGLPDEQPRLRRAPKPRSDPPPATTYFRWNLDQVEEKLRAKIQERTELRGNFIYQQAYRLLEKNRGHGIDLASFKDTMVNKLGLTLVDAEFEHLFAKYDTDQNGRIDIYEFINHVLPHDYGERTSWIEQSDERMATERRRANERDRASYLAGRFLSAHDASELRPDSTLHEMRLAIYKKLHEKTPTGVDQTRQAFQLLQRGTNAAVSLVDLRQTIKDLLGIALTEVQMHDLLKPFNRGGAVDVRAFVKSVMTTDGPHDSYVPNGLFTEQPPEKEPLSGRRHVDPKQQRAKSTESFLVSSKRVHGYNKAKGIAPKPYPRRHHRQSESGSHLKATKTTVQFTLSPEKIAATLARSGSTAPRQSLADLPTPDRREFHFRPPTAAVTTVNFVTPAEEKLAPAKVEASSSSSNVLQRRPKSSGRKHLVSPFSPIKRPDSPKATAFQRLPIPPRPTTPLATDASRAATLGGDESALDDADEGSDSSADDMGGDDANVVEGGLAALTVTDEPTPTTPRRRPTTAQQPSFEAFEPLAPPRISLVHQRQQTTTTYKSMKPNFRISESTFCCR